MKKLYIIFIALLIGLIAGMLQNDLIAPTVQSPDQAYYHGIRGQDMISLTINVDWGQEFLPGMLDILDKENVKATFFVTGNWANKFPDLLKDMAERGHEIGNHGYSHKHPKNLSEQGLINLIKKNEDLIYKLTGQKTPLFAPPYGEVDSRTAMIASSINYKTIMWSADTIDWQRPAPEIIVQRAINKVDDGGIILMHPTKPSLQALDEILKTLKDRGYKFVKVSKLIGLK